MSLFFLYKSRFSIFTLSLFKVSNDIKEFDLETFIFLNGDVFFELIKFSSSE